MKKIKFFITKLDVGGAERVLIDLANSLKDKYQIEIVVLYGGGNIERDALVPIRYINEKDIASPLSKKIYAFTLKFKSNKKKIIDEFFNDQHLVVAFLEGPATEILAEYDGPKIAFVHTNLKKHYNASRYNNLYKIYNKYNAVCAVSKESLASLPDKITVPKRVVTNYISLDRINRNINAYRVKESGYVLLVARLFPEKGVMRLLEINKKLLASNIHLNFKVVGDGPLKKDMIDYISDHNFTNIDMVGSLSNPYPYMHNADLIISTSLYEGFPLLAIEARLLNKKVLATDTGIREALGGYDKALIVPNNDEALYEALKKYSAGENIFGSIPGSIDVSLDKYLALFEEFLMI